MKNTIEIVPVDTDMEIMVNAVRILNNFKKAGFVRREAFVEMIMDEDRSYHSMQGMTRLNNFWAGRVKSKELNDDLERIFENLKVG